jgi:hypothetical protein
MGDFNPNSPAIRGMELAPTDEGAVQLFSSGIAIAERFRNTGTTSWTAVHKYLSAVQGTPGLNVEIVDTLVPISISGEYFPGTDTGATTAGWTRSTGAGTFFSHLAKNLDDSTWLQNTAASFVYSSLPMTYRGNATALSGRRIVGITLYARMRVTGGFPWYVTGRLTIGGIPYQISNAQVPVGTGFNVYNLGSWAFNPASSLPWTQTAVNTVVAAGATDSMGLTASSYFGGAGQFQVSGLYVVVRHVAENRKGYLYNAGVVRPGWDRYALTNLVAPVNNTYLYVVTWSPKANSSNYVTIPGVADLTGVVASGPTVAQGEHRQTFGMTHEAGVGTLANEGARITIFPSLLEHSATIQSQSQPYVDINPLIINAATTANTGESLTSAAGVNLYGGVRVPVGWESEGVQPDAPLTIQVKTLINGGSILATATLQPGESVSDLDLTTIAFAAGWTPTASTQYFVHFSSTATAGSGWSVGRLDTRSDNRQSGTGTTVANIEGAGQGGQTDGYFTNGAHDHRYEIPVSLLQAPTAPGSLTATVRAAA